MTDDVKPPFDFLDLRPVTRDTDKCLTSLSIYDNYGVERPWIKAGRATLQKHADHWGLKAYLTEGHYDDEHDSCYAFGLDLIGVTFEYVHSSIVQLHGWIRTNHADGFQIPPVDYDYTKDGVPCRCGRLTRPHFTRVPFYPIPNIPLYPKIAGCKVGIIFGQPRDEGG